jgi:type III secretion system YscD/HrpQ family protein
MPAHLIGQQGPLQGTIFALEEGEEWIIGRDPDVSDFTLDDSTVSRKHVQLSRTPEGISLKNLSTVNPVLINDEEVEGPFLLKEGDRVQIGRQSFVFSNQEISGEAPRIAPAKKKKSPPKGNYDDIFGEVEEPPPPSREESFEIERNQTVEHSPKEETPYDTIFEDSEESLPFHLLSPTPLLIKVIAGPNAGAEFGIEKGRSYTLGKDPNACEVVFQDLSVSRTHARLSVTADGVIEIEDLGSKNGTLVQGVPITEKQTITPQDVVALGTTLFLLIDREAPQETIYSPMPPTYESAKSVEPTKEETAAAAAEMLDWKQKPLPMKHLVLGGSFLTIFLVVFLSFFSLFKSESHEIVIKEPVDQIKESLAKYPDIQYSFNPGSGKLFLVGHVLNSVQYQELTFQLSQIAFIQSVENTVVIDELVWRMANDVINVNPAWRGLSVQSPKAGQFTVIGYLPSSDEARKVWEYLIVNFPYPDRLQNEIVVEENLNAQIQTLFASQGFGAVSFQIVNGDIVLSGRYAQPMEEKFHGLVKQLNQIKGVTKVENYAMAVTPNAAAIDLSQQFQVTGISLYDGVGYSVVLNGKVYTMGALVDGMKIVEIESNLILFEKDGLKYKIDYIR